MEPGAPPKGNIPEEQVTHYECLKTEVDGYISYSRRWARVWAAVYYSLRTGLIVISACVAAKSDLSLASNYVAILSLTVAVGTALDTWLKTGTRYKGHYMFNDKFIALYTDLELTAPTDQTKIETLKEQFKKLIDDYAVAVLPS